MPSIRASPHPTHPFITPSLPVQQARQRHRLRGRLPNNHSQARHRCRYRRVPPSKSILRTHIYTGANPSAEESGEAVEDGAEQVNNVAHSFRLQKVSPFDKKGYLTHIKVQSPCFISPSHLVIVSIGVYEESQGALGKGRPRQGQAF